MSYRQRKPLNKKSIIALIIAVVVVAAALVVMNRLESWQTIQGPSDENSNATYNIGARYFVRAITKSLSATVRQLLEAKVPSAVKRSTCTLSTLISLNAVLSASAAAS